jgi:hypothetical protein
MAPYEVASELLSCALPSESLARRLLATKPFGRAKFHCPILAIARAPRADALLVYPVNANEGAMKRREEAL